MSDAGVLSRFDVRDRRGKAVLVCASLLIHLALLGPILLRGLGADLRIPDLAPEDWLIPIELEPRPTPPGARDRPIQPAATSAARPFEPDEPRAGERQPEPRPTLAEAFPAETDVPAAPSAIADVWRVRPGSGERPASRAAIGQGCRAPRETLSQAERWACDDRFGQATRGARPVGPRRLTASEQRREQEFADQAAANEAWRNYRRGDGPYPGLHLLPRL